MQPTLQLEYCKILSDSPVEKKHPIQTFIKAYNIEDLYYSCAPQITT